MGETQEKTNWTQRPIGKRENTNMTQKNALEETEQNEYIWKRPTKNDIQWLKKGPSGKTKGG